MARLSKSHQFAIHEDISIPTPDPDPASQRQLELISDSENKIKTAVEELENARFLLEENDDALETLEEENHGEEEAARDERRVSAVSAFPDSVYESDNDVEDDDSNRAPRTPLGRPNLRQIDAIQKLQILSAPQLGLRTPRRPFVRLARSKNTTPKTLRSMQARGSPRRRRRISEQTEALEEEEQHYPLVLLHVTLLPNGVRWSEQSMQELLPANVLENVKLLRSKTSETLLSRGILIRHPQEEYDLLEERILEALELKEERLTKCGHFRNRDSVGSSSGSDSGIGLSEESCDSELCTTCQHHIKTSEAAIGDQNKKWSVKIFAANGLLRASSWAAAWPDMESVDVEILPWITEDMRRQLDERTEQEVKDRKIERQEEEEERIKCIVDEQVQLIREELTKRSELVHNTRENPSPEQQDGKRSIPDIPKERPISSASKHHGTRASSKVVSQVLQQSEIPLSTLLKNYVYLLAQDWRNVTMVLLVVLALSFALLFAASPRQTSAISRDVVDFVEHPPPIPQANDKTESIQVMSWHHDPSPKELPDERKETNSEDPDSSHVDKPTVEDDTCPLSLAYVLEAMFGPEVCPMRFEE